MTSLNNKYTNNRSMNGLINIYADNIEATNSTINDTLIVDGKDINTVVSQVDTNKTNLTGITYTPTPTPTTNITNKVVLSNQLNVTGTSTFGGNLNVSQGIYGYGSTNILDGSLSVLGFLETIGSSFFDNNLDVAGNLNVGKLGPGSSIDLTGTITIREPTNPNISMSILYIPAGAGFRFINNQPNGYMYFSTKDGAGNIKNFQFNSSQVYSNLLFYCDNWLAVSFNNQIVLGDANSAGAWLGASQKYVPNNAVTSGLVFYNKGLNNNVAYYTNFTHNDLSNVEVPTFRMNYNNIWSKVPHTMESKLTLLDNLVANSINITPTELSYISGVSSNIQTQLNNKFNSAGGTITGNIVINGTTSFNGNLSANETTITPIQLSYVSGATSNIQTQLNEKVSLSGTNTYTGTNTYPSISFTNGTTQTTAYTTANDTKLQALATITTGTMGANTTLTSGAFHSPTSISLVAGTYIITVNACVAVISGTTTVGQMLAGYSISSTGLSQSINLAILNGGGVTYNIGNQWSLNSSNIITVASTTTYYLQIQCTFGTASRMQYVQGNSAFRAVRIA